MICLRLPLCGSATRAEVRPVDEAAVIDALVETDAELTEWTDSAIVAVIDAERLERFWPKLEAAGVARHHVQPARMVDWDSVPSAALRPTHVGGVLIVPVGLDRPESDPSLEALEIDTGGAFGTGVHPTTRLCLERMAEWPATGILLDVGTGSGVLALAWLRRGGPAAVATDIDPTALDVATNNARRNRLQDRLTVTSRQPHDLCERFSRIVANVLAAPLIDMAPDLVRLMNPGARLVLSGFQAHQLQEVLQAYRVVGLRPVGEQALGAWSCLELTTSW